MATSKLVVASATILVILSGANAFQSFVPRSSSLTNGIHSISSRGLPQTFDRSRALLKMSQDDFGEGNTITSGGINLSGEPPFEIRGFSLGDAFLGVGVAVTAISFTEFFMSAGSEGLSGIGFVYGIPIALVGLSLKYAELAPVPVRTTPEAEALFEEKATETIKKIKSDVTRHRYGDEAHLESTVKALGLVMPQSEYPQLQWLDEGVEDGEYTFSMVFQSKETPFKVWNEPAKIPKFETFFGPGVNAEVVKVNGAERLVAIKLTTGEKKVPPAATETEEAPASVQAEN
eukprot:CAMPEP_0113936612 /NCGR_PEP_ID=MMETSP1339-20121228/3481_1 /TAXON_ID=94617 /ORGANISM="Fibrocapsa japonica" /LENGTH=288 /DNA_ID=CAMNT_0000939143 /DNA_START=18 /DNA_END=884 /DNA_ORIENTATION=- /assembly_acc=CAM_ASM_000762